MEPIVVGVDLAGVETRPTDLGILRGWRAETSLVYGDDDLLAGIRRAEPAVVTVDAPLSFLPTVFQRGKRGKRGGKGPSTNRTRINEGGRPNAAFVASSPMVW